MDSYLGPLAALMSSFTWAVGVTAFTPLSKRHPAYIINLHRIFLALPSFLLILVFNGQLSSAISSIVIHQVGWAAVAVLASYAFGDVLFLMATMRVGAPAALAIASTYPVFAGLAGLLFRGEVLSLTRAIGILVVIVGTICVILSGPRSEAPISTVPRVQDDAHIRRRLRNPYITGILLAFGAAFCWALNTVAISGIGQGLDAISVNALRLSIALFLCPLIGIAMHGTRSFKLIPAREFLPILPVFAVEAIAGPFFYVYGLSHSHLAIGAALTSLAPVISVPFALLLGHEKFSWAKTLGVTAVVAGIWVMLF